MITIFIYLIDYYMFKLLLKKIEDDVVGAYISAPQLGEKNMFYCPSNE